jgi:hypothetical protein
MALIELRRAFICGSDHITDSPMQCDCGSRALMPLVTVLGTVTECKKITREETEDGEDRTTDEALRDLLAV